MSDKTENIKRAVALTYSAGKTSAPRAIATGAGADAESIIKAAVESGIPVYENPELMRKLAAKDLLPNVPQELYSAASAIVSYLYDISDSIKN